MRRSLALLLCGAAGAEAAACLTPAGDRTDCGFSGIDQVGCERKGCCWGPLQWNPQNLPWCFLAVPETPAPPTPAPVTIAPETPAPATPAPATPAPATPAPHTPAPATPAPQTPVPMTPAPGCALVTVRGECGYSGIGQADCVDRGCCWDEVSPNPGGDPFCFHRLGCAAGSEHKTACGFVGIDQGGCFDMGCCWEPVWPNPGAIPWCFHTGTAAPTPAPTPAPPLTPEPAPTPAPSLTCAGIPDSVKRDCGKVEQGGCIAAGCCWAAVSPNPQDAPWCFHPAFAPAPPPAPTPFPPLPPDAGPFSTAELTAMAGFFFKNIDIERSGMVAAAPGHSVLGASYYYHWMRDGALTMRTLLRHFPFEQVDQKLRSYVTHVEAAQDPNGIDVRGEPKFLIPSGKPYNGGWCRPQNDGAAIRAGTLSLYALVLLSRGQDSYVGQHLWPATGGVIRRDLDYAAKWWDQQGCDLWEEVRSDDFFWQFVHTRRGLLLGAEVAAKMGDDAAAKSYRGAAAAVAKRMAAHTYSTAQHTYVYETACCSRREDSAALLGLLHDDPADPVFPLSGVVAAGTVATLDQAFSSFPINAQGPKLWGRYPGDTYAGGNPWVLASLGKAQALYRAARELHLAPAPQGEDAWRRYAAAATTLRAASANATRTELAQALAGQGDALLARLRSLVQPLGFHLPEQLDRRTGRLANVADLTWSYAALFEAVGHRSECYAALAR
eukprot:TRINITY_DN1812_c0_g2_i1.p1 TRINITY_DN1812_c0_g2~~TRINITY_DN1812_c0_g2_i1.p1  ORF type:complete len:746 (+),score=218.97 TRINITY_DN1812_c0_g2_i1:77-2239(+)